MSHPLHIPEIYCFFITFYLFNGECTITIHVEENNLEELVFSQVSTVMTFSYKYATLINSQQSNLTYHSTKCNDLAFMAEAITIHFNPRWMSDFYLMPTNIKLL